MLNKTNFCDIATFQYGKLPRKDKVSDTGIFPIYSGYRIVGYCDDYLYEKSQLVIVARGVGGTGDVKISPAKSYITNLSIVATLNESIVTKEFLYYYFLKNNLRYLDSGSAQSQITINDLSKVVLYLPTLGTQNKIVNILSSFDKKIENNIVHIASLQDSITEIYRNWFNDFNYPNATGELVFSNELNRQIPADWDVMQFQKFISPYSEKIGEVNAPIYSTTNNGISLRDEKFNKSLTKSQSKNKKVVKDDLIFGLSREILNFGVFTEEIGSVSPAYQIFKIDTTKILPFMLELEMRINMPRYMDILQLGAREGQGIRKDYLMNKYHLVPKIEIQEKFFELYSVFEQKTAKLKEENEVLAEIRDTLLPKLMSGELPVEVGEKE